MANLDSLGWAAGIAIRSYGVRIGLRVTDPAAMAELRPALPFGWKPAKTPIVDHLYSLIVAGGPGAGRRRKLHLLFGGTILMARQRSLSAIVDDLEREMTLLVGTKAPRRVFVHAGAVAWRGRAIVLPGRSFTGKSTLVAALVRRGARYLSDEYAVFDNVGRVHPYPRPLGIREPGEQKGRPTLVETLGGRPRRTPLPLGWVVVAPFTSDASWGVRPIPPGEATLELVANSLAAREAPQRVLGALATACSGAQAFRGTRGEANGAADAILRLASTVQR
jgi:hypothetical protein